MLQRIVYKIEKAGATSKKKAVTIEEAKLNLQEQNWLMGKIKKTKNQRYYL